MRVFLGPWALVDQGQCLSCSQHRLKELGLGVSLSDSFQFWDSTFQVGCGLQIQLHAPSMRCTSLCTKHSTAPSRWHAWMPCQASLQLIGCSRAGLTPREGAAATHTKTSQPTPLSVALPAATRYAWDLISNIESVLECGSYINKKIPRNYAGEEGHWGRWSYLYIISGSYTIFNVAFNP